MHMNMSEPQGRNRFVDKWSLDHDIAFLNHGSFGACPTAVLAYQAELRERLEKQPVQFFVRDLEKMLDEARESLAQFLGGDPAGLAWVANVTTGVNAVIRSLDVRPGDELLTTDHEYNACRNVLDFVAQRSGAKVVVANIPFPLTRVADVSDAILECVSSKTRLALLDHVTSQTGLVLPIEELVSALSERGVDTLVDGAHAAGMLDVDLDVIGAAYYTGNCHKWLCAPKGAGFLYVSAEHRETTRPAVISHGANSPRTDRSRFLSEFDWVGTTDPTAILTVPTAMRFMQSLLPGGWPELRQRNRTLAMEARDILCDALAMNPPCPDEMIASLASFPLPDGDGSPSTSPLYADPLQDVLLHDFGIEVPIIPWPEPPGRLIRISAQVYNERAEFERLGEALRSLCGSS
jgi:isopenicillin-N epimerase